MSELWIPGLQSHPDVNNIFDMMTVLQENIDSKNEREAKLEAAHFALQALGMFLHHMRKTPLEVTVVSNLVVYNDDGEELPTILKADIGLRGAVDDIHCVQIGEHVPLTVAIGIDAHTIFSANDPENAEYAFMNFRAPINNIQYVKTHAA